MLEKTFFTYATRHSLWRKIVSTSSGSGLAAEKIHLLPIKEQKAEKESERLQNANRMEARGMSGTEKCHLRAFLQLLMLTVVKRKKEQERNRFNFNRKKAREKQQRWEK
jgi:hypothetical protein